MDPHNMQNDISQDLRDGYDEKSQIYQSPMSIKTGTASTIPALPSRGFDKDTIQSDFRLHYRTIKGLIYHAYNLLTLTPRTLPDNDSRATALVGFECAVASLLLHITHRSPGHIRHALAAKHDALDEQFRLLAKPSQEVADEADQPYDEGKARVHDMKINDAAVAMAEPLTVLFGEIDVLYFGKLDPIEVPPTP